MYILHYFAIIGMKSNLREIHFYSALMSLNRVRCTIKKMTIQILHTSWEENAIFSLTPTIVFSAQRYCRIFNSKMKNSIKWLPIEILSKKSTIRLFEEIFFSWRILMTSQQDACELGNFLMFESIFIFHLRIFCKVKEFVILETKCLKNEEQINHQNMINLIKKSWSSLIESKI